MRRISDLKVTSTGTHGYINTVYGSTSAVVCRSTSRVSSKVTPCGAGCTTIQNKTPSPWATLLSRLAALPIHEDTYIIRPPSAAHSIYDAHDPACFPSSP